MSHGIAIYLGLGTSAAANQQLLQDTADHGIKRVFTSLHIPETDTAVLTDQLQALLALCRTHQLELIADISPASLELTGLSACDAAELQRLGLGRLRLDYGYSIEEIVQLSHTISIQFNASTLNVAYLNKLLSAGLNLANTEAMFNYYPRPHTGMSYSDVYWQNQLLQQYGIKTAAFIPCEQGRREPLCAGLPTIEAHRSMPVAQAAQQLLALGIDSIFIADCQPTQQELQDLATAQVPSPLVLRMQATNITPDIAQLLSHTFTCRNDDSAELIRTNESRSLCKNISIAPSNTAAPTLGDVLIDNDGYGRYQGELQIAKLQLQADKRTNIIGKIIAEDRYLIPCLVPGSKFRLVVYME